VQLSGKSPPGRQDGRGGGRPPAAARAPPPARLALADFATAADLEAAASADELRAQLELRGMKAGGTRAERAARLFLVRDVASDDAIPAELRRGAGRRRGRKRRRAVA
jgi:hypothetical protein